MSIGGFEIVACVLVAGAWLAFHLVLVAMNSGGDVPISWRTGRTLALGVPTLFLAAMLVTPPDVISQLILAVPLCVLYGVGAGVWLVMRYRRGPSSASDVRDASRERG